MTSRIGHTVKSLADYNIGGLLSKPSIRQNKLPAIISGYTVIEFCLQCELVLALCLALVYKTLSYYIYVANHKQLQLHAY